MKYLLMIFGSEAEDAARSPEAQAKIIEAYGAFTEHIIARKMYIGGEALELTTTAKSVRVRDGKALVTDGPFAETREALGGYYLIEAENMDQAVEVAAKIPTAEHGTVEVRPIMVFDEQ